MTLHEEISKLKKEIDDRLNHDYLMKHIPHPVIDEDKLLVVYLMFKESGRHRDLNHYVTSIMLIQTALDTHETIAPKNEFGEHGTKNRQLTVLAGDYYSALFYRILAELENKELLVQIAGAIEQMNVDKMNFYNGDLPWHQKFQLLRSIETAIILPLADALGFSSWKSFIADYFFAKRLVFEKYHLLNGKIPKFLYQLLTRSNGTKKQLSQMLDQYINELSPALVNQFKKGPYIMEALGRSSVQWMEPTGDRPNQLAEEG